TLSRGRQHPGEKAMRVIVAALAGFGAAAMVMLGERAVAAEITVMSSAAFKEAYNELVPHFEKSTGNRVVTIFAGGVNVTKRISDGETVDLVISSAAAIDGLIKQ